jgi:hypothetical protein
MEMKYILCFLFTAVFILSLNGQENIEEKIHAIRNEYKKINLELESYTKKLSIKEIIYYYYNRVSPDSVHTTSITDASEIYGYFNKNKELVLLTNEYRGEENSWHDYQYYFRNGEVFFIFIREGADEEETQKRIYFWDGKIIRALIKEKKWDDKRNISEIENRRDDFIMDKVEEQSLYFLKDTKNFIEDFYKGLQD